MTRTLVKKMIAAALLAGASQINLDSEPVALAQGQTVCGLPPSRKVDEYGEVSGVEEKSRLEKFAALLKAEQKDVQGFVVAYVGRGAKAGEALRRADRAKEQLIVRDAFYTALIDNDRLNTLDCGLRELPATELWLTPVGAAPPLCSPTIKPTAPQPTGRVRRRATPRPRRSP